MTSSENVSPQSIQILAEEDKKGKENLNAADELKKFGPIGRENYKKFAIDIIDEGFKDGTLDRKDRERMWANFARLEEAVATRLDADRTVNPIIVLEEEVWKIRQKLDTAKKLPLDDHHRESKDYAKLLTVRHLIVV
jgi:polyhydroxyalkanoate synthesis regulator phasin